MAWQRDILAALKVTVNIIVIVLTILAVLMLSNLVSNLTRFIIYENKCTAEKEQRQTDRNVLSGRLVNLPH